MQNLFRISLLITVLLVFSPNLVSITYGESGCEQSDWDSPLDRDLNITRPFNPNQPSNPHFGTDYAANNGDNVRSVADGEILKKDYQYDDKTKKGWGEYVVIEHPDGSTTLYAHLVDGSTNHLYEGMPVRKGDTIGKADATGGVRGTTGNHLHLEYSPSGEPFDKATKTDPNSCFLCNSEPPATITISGPDTPSDGSQYTATGGKSPYSWSISKGSITQTGVVTVSGQCGTATVTATDACGNTASKDVRMPSGRWVYLGRTFFGNSSDCCISVSDYPHMRGGLFQCAEINGGTWILYWLIQGRNDYCVGNNFCYQSRPSCYPGAVIPALDAIDTWEWRCP